MARGTVDDISDPAVRRRVFEVIERYERRLSVAMLDLDHFKEVNDSLGHTVGDQLLIEIAKRFGTVEALRTALQGFLRHRSSVSACEVATEQLVRLEHRFRDGVGPVGNAVTVEVVLLDPQKSDRVANQKVVLHVFRKMR